MSSQSVKNFEWP